MDRVCTKFVERNSLFTLPHVIAFQAVKVGDDLMCVYHLGMFSFKEGYGYLECLTVCQFVVSLFRSLGSVELGFVSEEELEIGEEIELVKCVLR
ncbi:MAG: hypothetical protein ABSD73_04225 [Candidatus Bathyarchaeia archaeon]